MRNCCKERQPVCGDDVSGLNDGMERRPERTFVYASFDRKDQSANRNLRPTWLT
jgi:hypothetical protein